MRVEEATVVTRWDDLEILRLIGKLQEQYGGGLVWSLHDRDLMDPDGRPQASETSPLAVG
jgi:hypothetical protein